MFPPHHYIVGCGHEFCLPDEGEPDAYDQIGARETTVVGCGDEVVLPAIPANIVMY